jgi:Ca-activated chloride channel homolog
VTPAKHNSLQSLRVPLVTHSGSYQKAWQLLGEGKLPAPQDVHIEEFLAAVNYEFPAVPPGWLALRSAAGPSAFGSAGTRLLQIGVQAGALPPQRRAGTAMTIVVETSGGMRRGGTMAMVRRAVADMAAQISNEDRISLIASGGEPNVLVSSAGRRKMRSILSAIQSLTPEQSSNLGAGLESAVKLAKDSAAAGLAQRIVLVTDGLSDPNEDTVRSIEALLKSAGEGIVLQILDVGESSSERNTELLTRIAVSGNGAVRRAVDVDAARFALLETLTGRDPVVAKGASLQINFNPQVVAAYRLLGHETETLTGANAAPLAIEMRANETATALLEVRLNAQGGDDVAIVELNWLDAATGEKRVASQRISRLQFAKSFAEAPLSLQSAAIVGHTAEILRGSYFAVGTKSFEPVLELIAQASPLVSERPGMMAFKSFVEQAEKVRLRGTKR